MHVEGATLWGARERARKRVSRGESLKPRLAYYEVIIKISHTLQSIINDYNQTHPSQHQVTNAKKCVDFHEREAKMFFFVLFCGLLLLVAASEK